MNTNYLVILLTAFIPLIIGAIWYNPKIGFGKTWVRLTGKSEEELAAGNMPLIMGLAYVFSLLVCSALINFAIHQYGFYQLFFTDIMMEKAGAQETVDTFMAQYGNKHRHFMHGGFHGLIFAFVTALPMIGINALFERRGFKYIALHFGYWLICSFLMGGILCQFV